MTMVKISVFVFAVSFSFNMSPILKPKTTIMQCFVCTNPATQTCSRCKVLAYCSRKCQKMHWPHHKHLCTDKGLELGSVVFKNYESFAKLPLGCCLDCYDDDGKCNEISFYCDICNKARICPDCEAKFGYCQLCRR